MNPIKRLIPGKLKTYAKFLIYDLLNIPYSKYGLSLAIINYLKDNQAINFFDIGANVGYFSESLNKTYRIKKGVIIEPIALHTKLLKSKFDNDTIFKIYPIALSEKDGFADFYINEEFDSVSSLLEIEHKSAELEHLNISKPKKSTVVTRTLDSVATENFKNEIIDLVKIDVQGAEHLILMSGTETLKRTKLVYTEFSYKPLYKGSSTFYDLYHLMYKNDFILVDVAKGYTNNDGELLQGDALFLNKNLCI